MSQTTGVILAMGATTVVNRTVFQGEPMDWRIPIATGLLAVGFSLGERAYPQGAEILAWTAFLTTLITRVDPKVPSPAESALAWWRSSGSGSGGGAGSGKSPAPGGTRVTGQSGSMEA